MCLCVKFGFVCKIKTIIRSVCFARDVKSSFMNGSNTWHIDFQRFVEDSVEIYLI